MHQTGLNQSMVQPVRVLSDATLNERIRNVIQTRTISADRRATRGSSPRPATSRIDQEHGASSEPRAPAHGSGARTPAV